MVSVNFLLCVFLLFLVVPCALLDCVCVLSCYFLLRPVALLCCVLRVLLYDEKRQCRSVGWRMDG